MLWVPRDSPISIIPGSARLGSAALALPQEQWGHRQHLERLTESQTALGWKEA